MIIDCISDLHGHFPKLEGGDLLIVGGDLTARDFAHELIEFGDWVNSLCYKKKIVIAGNHDNLIAGGRWKLCPPCEYGWDFDYLCDSGTEFEYWKDGALDVLDTTDRIKIKKKIKIWGSPWTKTFSGMNPRCKAFTCDTEEELDEKWALIPDDVDILITHSPPYGVLDKVKCYESGKIENAGSKSLLSQLSRIRPKVWVFGHIHEGYGQKSIPMCAPIYINACHVNKNYEPVNKPVRIIL